MYKCTSPPISVFFVRLETVIPVSKHHPAAPSASPCRPCSLHWNWHSTSLSAFAFTFASILTLLALCFRHLSDPLVHSTPTARRRLDSRAFGARDSAPRRLWFPGHFQGPFVRNICLLSAPSALRFRHFTDPLVHWSRNTLLIRQATRRLRRLDSPAFGTRDSAPSGLHIPWPHIYE